VSTGVAEQPGVRVHVSCSLEIVARRPGDGKPSSEDDKPVPGKRATDVETIYVIGTALAMEAMTAYLFGEGERVRLAVRHFIDANASDPAQVESLLWELSASTFMPGSSWIAALNTRWRTGQLGVLIANDWTPRTTPPGQSPCR
jgi:hypothetical protein